MGETTVRHYSSIVKFVTSANVACGSHAGSPEIMRGVVALCRRNGVGVGAHPSFEDKEGFGRKAVEMPRKELESLLLHQVGALEAIAAVQSVKVGHVKAHGALYNMAMARRDYAEAIAETCKGLGKILIAPQHSAMAEAGERIGVKVAYEGFADRGYNSDGTLAERGRQGALITSPDDAAERALLMAGGRPFRTVDGKFLSIAVRTICVHGDTPGAGNIARAVRRRLEGGGVRLSPLSEMF